MSISSSRARFIDDELLTTSSLSCPLALSSARTFDRAALVQYEFLPRSVRKRRCEGAAFEDDADLELMTARSISAKTNGAYAA